MKIKSINNIPKGNSSASTSKPRVPEAVRNSDQKQTEQKQTDKQQTEPKNDERSQT